MSTPAPALNEPNADIQLTPSSSNPTPIQGKRKGNFPPKNQNAKKPRFTQKADQARHGGTAYNKLAIPVSHIIRPIKTYFPVFVSDEGCTQLVRMAYSFVAGKDHHIARQVPEFLMQYAATMVYHARLLYIGKELGYRIDREHSWMKSSCMSIILPDVVAQYIETLGVVEMPNGQRVVPLVPTWQEYVNSPHIERLRVIWAQLHGDVEPIPELPVWGLDNDIIIRYNNMSARATRMGASFRAVSFDNVEGRKELLVSIRHHHQGVIPCAPMAVSLPEAINGSIHYWRRVEEQDGWLPADNHLLHPDFEDTVVNPSATVHKIMCDTQGGNMR